MNTGEVFYYIPVFISLLLSLKQELKWKNGWVLITISPSFPSGVLGFQDGKIIFHHTEQTEQLAAGGGWFPCLCNMWFNWWFCSFLKLFLVSRYLEVQKFLLSLYSSHQLFGIMQDLLGGFLGSTFECKSLLKQDMSKRKQSEWAGVLIPPLLAILRNVHIRKNIFSKVQCLPTPSPPHSISSVSSVIGPVWS